MKNNQATRRGSRQDNTPLRRDKYAYRSSKLPPLHFGGANTSNSYPSILMDDKDKLYSHFNRIDSSEATPRASGAGGTSF